MVLRRIVNLLILLFTYSAIACAQQDNTLFMLHNIPQSNFTNPAVQIQCPTYVGVPLLSSIHFNVNSTGFSYGDVANGSEIANLNTLVAGLHRWDFVSEEVHYTPVSFGFMYDRNQYFNFAWSERVETKVFFPKKLLSLFTDGNTQYVGVGMKTRNPGVNTMYYREFSLGYSKKVNSGLILGVHGKILFGLAGAFTRRKPVDVEVDALTHNIDARWNPMVDVAYPLSVATNTSGNVTDVTADGFSPLSFFSNFGNQGIAADVGFIWQHGDVEWSGSLLDLGFIWWHKQTTRFENSGHFVYRGATPADSDNPDDYISQLGDSLNNQIQVEYSLRGFITLLNPKIYLGASYPVMERFDVGAHVRAEWYPGRPVMGLTLSGMIFGKKGGSAALSYSVMNGSFINVGAGLGWGGETFQFYVLSDNLLVAFYPEKVRNANLRFGFNLFFGCIEKKRRVEVPRGNGCGCYWSWDDKTRRKSGRN